MRKELFKRVDIVIPIYNAYDSLVSCIESIQEHTDLLLHRVILVNDCSPDKRIKPYIDRLEGAGFVVLHNEENKGFSGSVNIGMSYSDSNDVVLLNTDTIVTKNWIEKLVNCAYSAKEIGTVTPLSNSATIASVPNAFVDNHLPEGKTVDAMAELVEHSSFREYPNITVAVGFCMFIKREVIQKVGLFDAETFQRGYGEENDFCSRADIYGYRHVLCDDTFIFHEGTQSFLTAEKEQLQKEHREYLDEKYPKQMRKNDIFCANNPQQYLRDNIVLHLALENGKKNVLYLLHYDFKEGAQNNCGGTQFHVKDLTEQRKDYNVFVAARDGNSLLLTAYVNEESYTFRFAIEETPDFFTFRNRRLRQVFSMIVDACRIDLVHIQNVIGLSFDLFDVAAERTIPLCLTLHDYIYVCPNYTLLNENKVLCMGECTSCKGMSECLSRSLQLSNADKYLTEWRKECDRVMGLCDWIFAPSESVRKLYSKVYPHMEEKILVIEHGMDWLQDTREQDYVAPRYTTEITYSIDSLFAEDGYADMVCGWAYLKDCDNSDTNIYLDILQDDGTKKRYKTEKTKRPDVDAFFGGTGRYVNVGFSVGIHPSDCLSERFTAEVVIERNGVFYSNGELFGKLSPRSLPERKLNVAFLGGLNYDKGSSKAYDLILEDKEEKINWYMMGGIDPSEPLHDIVKRNVKKIGFYSRGEINQLLQDYRIDLVCILSLVSETFSYTLSEAYMNQIPVLAINLGAVGERVDKLGCGWLVKPEITAKELYEKVQWITENLSEYQKVKEKIAVGKHKSISQMVEEYAACYRKLFKDDIQYQEYDAKVFYHALEKKADICVSEDKYRILAEELQQKLQQIENSFWYKLTKNLHCIEFPGKIRLRNWVYRVVGTWKAKRNK